MKGWQNLLIPFCNYFTDHREPFDVREMLQVEPNVGPECRRSPASEDHHLEQDIDLAVSFNEPSELRQKTLVIPMSEITADAHF